MKNFEYAHPRNLAELLEVLDDAPPATELMGGGTDLVGLMKRMVVQPERVVNVSDVEEMRSVERDPISGALLIGGSVRLKELLDHPLLEQLAAVRQAIEGTASLQFQWQSTLAGELCRRPHCWYFRSGHGLLAQQGKMVVDGDNRYHAILGNQGPAKFVNASRLAPALAALGAKVRIAGASANGPLEIPLEALYQTPRREGQRENILRPGQVITQVVVPCVEYRTSATYEVKHGVGPDDPLAVAAGALDLVGGLVQTAKLVLGQVAPVPWVAREAAELLIGQRISEAVAERVGEAALAGATPLSQNRYKVQLAKVAVKRAILQAATAQKGELYV